MKQENKAEGKIKEAARTVFLKKGYAATRTRDIAEASGENLALINYYFRSKELLYKSIMMDVMNDFINVMAPVFNNPNTKLDEKIELIIANYINLFKRQPDMPMFVLNEINAGAKHFIHEADLKSKLIDSTFFLQLAEILKQKNKQIHPIQFFISMLGMTIFPFAAAPMLKELSGQNEENLSLLMEQRKQLIPLWIKAMLDS